MKKILIIMLFAVLASCNSDKEPMIESEFVWSVVSQNEVICDIKYDGDIYKVEINCLPGSYWRGSLYYKFKTTAGGYYIEFPEYSLNDLEKLKKYIEINFATINVLHHY